MQCTEGGICRERAHKFELSPPLSVAILSESSPQRPLSCLGIGGLIRPARRDPRRWSALYRIMPAQMVQQLVQEAVCRLLTVKLLTGLQHRPSGLQPSCSLVA